MIKPKKPQLVISHTKPYRHEGGIPKLKGNKMPTEFIFFDTETWIKELPDGKVEFPLRLGVAIYVKINTDYSVSKRCVLRFYDTSSFIDILKTYIKGRKTVYVFAHNIKFDIMVLNLPLLFSDAGVTSKLPIINERMFIWRANFDKARAIFLDTANYGVISVELLGKDLGYEKQTVDFKQVDEETLLRYCVRDTEILEKFILSYIQFIHSNQLGSFRLTLASQSLAAWRTRFMRKTVHIHNNISALELERKSYHGGRTECFQIGTLPEQLYYYLDVNSMYPYVMKTSVVPIKFMYGMTECSVEKLYLYLLAHYVIADVELNTKTNAYPLVFDNKLVFPTGNFRTVLHHKELSYAINRGDVLRVFSVSLYEYANIFGYYVDFFYELKKQSKENGNNSWYLLSKLMMNSLYGKMAQQGIIQEIVKGPYERIIKRSEGHALHTFDYTSEINWFGTIIRESKQGESAYSFPACAGAITANARMLLQQYIECAEIKNVVYCDTDSLICTQRGYDNLKVVLSDTELGMLKLEKTSHYVEINGNKDYEFGDTRRIKGVSMRAKQLSRNKWLVLQFDGILPWFNAGTNRNASAKYIKKQRQQDYNKGSVDRQSGRVTPLRIIYDVATLKHSIYQPT